MKHGNAKGRKSCLLAFICAVGLLAPYGCRARRMSKTEASAAFKKYVLSPVPESVTNIRADQPKDFGGYRYTFRFKVDRDDLVLLTNSGPFAQVWNVDYENGRLSWHWDRNGPFGISKYRSGMPCYDHTREPVWFRPGLWGEPEAYAFWKEGDLVNTEIFSKDPDGPTTVKVLIYNEKEAEAYFIVYYSEK